MMALYLLEEESLCPCSPIPSCMGGEPWKLTKTSQTTLADLVEGAGSSIQCVS